MATTVGRLTIHVGASTQSLARDLSKGTQLVKGFAVNVQSGMQSALQTLAHVTIAVQGVRRAFSMLKGFVDDINEVAKASTGLGISVEQFTSLEFAIGQLSTVSGPQFGTAMQKLARNLQDAADGSGEAIDSLDKLGLSAKEIAALPLDQALLLIADRMANVDSASVRTQIAMDLFGRAGANMAVALAKGSSEIERLQGRADEIGATLSGDASVAAEQFTDALDEFNKSVRGAAAELIESLTPATVDALKAFTETIATLRVLGEWLGYIIEAIESLGVSFTAIAQIMAGLVLTIGFLAAAYASLAAAQAVVAALSGPAGWIALGVAAGAAAAVIGTVAAAQSVATKRAKEMSRELTKTREASKAAGTAIGELARETKTAKEEFEEAGKKLEEFARRGEAITKSLRTPLEKANDEMAELNELLAGGHISAETFARGTAKIREELEGASKAADELRRMGPIELGSAQRGTTEGFVRAERARQRLAGGVDARRAEVAAIKGVGDKVESGSRAIVRTIDRKLDVREVKF